MKQCAFCGKSTNYYDERLKCYICIDCKSQYDAEIEIAYREVEKKHPYWIIPGGINSDETSTSSKWGLYNHNVIEFKDTLTILNDDGLKKKLLERDYEYQRKMHEYEIKGEEITKVIFW